MPRDRRDLALPASRRPVFQGDSVAPGDTLAVITDGYGVQVLLGLSATRPDLSVEVSCQGRLDYRAERRSANQSAISMCFSFERFETQWSPSGNSVNVLSALVARS
jgi:hypothetical protein